MTNLALFRLPSSDRVLVEPLFFESQDLTPSTRSSTSESVSVSSPLWRHRFSLWGASRSPIQDSKIIHLNVSFLHFQMQGFSVKWDDLRCFNTLKKNRLDSFVKPSLWYCYNKLPKSAMCDKSATFHADFQTENYSKWLVMWIFYALSHQGFHR